MRFGSVCSGIEAASVAWHPIGMKASWLAEVDVAASLVLAHRLGATAPQHMPSPADPGLKAKEVAARKAALKRIEREKSHWGDRLVNWGDFTRLPDAVRCGAADAPDVLCGGTPCQSYSIAGRREGLEDSRGQLTLKFVELADVIDEKRAGRGEHPCVVFWENVPGVLSSKDNAFGCFLADLAGEDVPLQPPGGKWTNAGVVLGPKRAVAWIVKDAQYFGLAQRRARVFVVASAREGFDPAAVLFEFDGVRRDSAPSREAWQEVAGTAPEGFAGSFIPSSFGKYSSSSSSSTLRAAGGDYGGGTEALLVERPRHIDLSVIAMAHGQGGAEISVDRCPTLTCNHEAPIAAYGVALRGREGGGGDKPHVLCFDTTQITSPGNYSSPRSGDPCHPITAAGDPPAIAYAIQERAVADTNCGPGGKGWREDDCAYTPEARNKVQAVAFSCKDYGADATLELAPTMRAMGHDGSHANAGGQLAVVVHGTQDPCVSEHVAFALGRNNGGENAVCVTGSVTHTLTAEGFDASEDGTGRGNPIIPVLPLNTQVITRGGALGRNTGFGLGEEFDPSFTLQAAHHHGVFADMAVRRLIPIEAERLQGFDDNWTLVPSGKGFAADGPRYKQLGNSWAVPCVRWIGSRIVAHIAELDARPPVEIDPLIIWLLAA